MYEEVSAHMISFTGLNERDFLVQKPGRQINVCETVTLLKYATVLNFTDIWLEFPDISRRAEGLTTFPATTLLVVSLF